MFQAIGRERSGMYTCHVITGDQDPVMEAGVFVDVILDTGYGDDDMTTQRSLKRISSQEQSGAVKTKTVSDNSPEIIEAETVMTSKENDSSREDSIEDGREEEIPSKAEIALLVSNSMKIIFRQLADIDQRLKYIEKKVLKEE